MGADLYIKLISEENRTKYEKPFYEWIRKRDEAVDDEAEKTCQEKADYYYNKMNDESGYYRDSYNNSNLLWQFDLDYWAYFAKLLDHESNLTPEKAQELLDELKLREPIFQAKIKAKEPNEKKYFIAKYFQFQRFLNRAIKMKVNIEASI